MSELRGRRAVVADLMTGVFVFALGVATVVHSAQMPTFTEQGSNPLTAPGIFPALVGLCFVVCGALLALRSRRKLGAVTEDADDGPSPLSWPVVLGFLLMVVAVALVGRLDIRLVLAAYSLVFCAAFVKWDRARLPRQILGVAIVTVIAAFAIPVAFEDLFLVRMP